MRPPVAPTAPEKQQLLIGANATAIAINLASWREGGCPIEAFQVAYKVASSLEWVTVPREDLPPLPLALLPQSSGHANGITSKTPGGSNAANVILGNLVPSMPYLLLVRATNSAGTTEAQYDFVTSHLTARDNPLSSTVGARRSPFFLQLEVVIPVAASVVVVALVAGAICFVVKNNRENMHPYDESGGSGFGVLRKNQTAVGGVGMGVSECVHLADMDGCNKMEPPGAQLLKKTNEGYYATPYATTRLSGLNLTGGVHNAMVAQHPGHPGHAGHPPGVQVQAMCGGEQRKFSMPIGSSPDCFKQRVSEEESSYATVKRTPRQMRQSSDFNIYNYPAGTAGTIMRSPDEMSDLDSSTIGQWESQSCGGNKKFRAIQGEFVPACDVKGSSTWSIITVIHIETWGTRVPQCRRRGSMRWS
ncbi:Down syndrome cell adhesion molecule-like [Tropilaelaps mercedesae]|uniref:Down syndrome cell adhesion molecule-like n=1 Tax=Tropilaelaps mercedesae TaxID=418985 RepID=A0A1V9XBU8_9ACAR|nr:Down syndrome cell adhesion molecule-like [Tropilaelaps mercedesae]